MSAGLRTEISEHLGQYVYALVDPRDGIPFYVGKGTASRVLSHGFDAAKWASADAEASVANSKLAKINEIASSGNELDVWILKRQLRDSEYSAVEATLIDLLATFPVAALTGEDRRTPLVGGTPLTNKVRGGGSETGIVRLKDLIRDFSAPDLSDATPLLLVTLNNWTPGMEDLPGGGERTGSGFKREWTDRAVLNDEISILGQSVCCWWVLNPKRLEDEGIEHMVACFRGVTRGLFKIVPDSAETRFERKTKKKKRRSNRTGYRVEPVTSGELWESTIGEFGHRMPKKKRGEQAQFRYWPFAQPS